VSSFNQQENENIGTDIIFVIGYSNFRGSHSLVRKI
jgi:hypothetical protein